MALPVNCITHMQVQANSLITLEGFARVRNITIRDFGAYSKPIDTSRVLIRLVHESRYTELLRE